MLRTKISIITYPCISTNRPIFTLTSDNYKPSKKKNCKQRLRVHLKKKGKTPTYEYITIDHFRYVSMCMHQGLKGSKGEWLWWWSGSGPAGTCLAEVNGRCTLLLLSIGNIWWKPFSCKKIISKKGNPFHHLDKWERKQHIIKDMHTYTWYILYTLIIPVNLYHGAPCFHLVDPLQEKKNEEK